MPLINCRRHLGRKNESMLVSLVIKGILNSVIKNFTLLAGKLLFAGWVTPPGDKLFQKTDENESDRVQILCGISIFF